MQIQPPHQPIFGGMRKAANGLVFLMSVVLLQISFPVLTSAAEPVEVVIRGLEDNAPALANVHAALALPPGLVQDGDVNRQWLDRFVEQAPGKAETALEPFGFYNALVTAALESAGEGRYRIAVTVVAGRPVRVMSVAVKVEGPGAGERSLVALTGKFPLKEGDVLRQDIYEEAKGKFRSGALQSGCLDADYSVHEIIISKAESSARIVLVLDTGPQYRFDKTAFEGAPEYPSSFLGRYLAYKPGQVFSFEKLGRTQMNLLNADRFSDVVVTPEKEKAAGLAVPVVVSMKPLPTKRLRMGAGYGTDTGPRVLVEYKNVNVFHSGRELSGKLAVSKLLQGIGISYIIPGSRDIDTLTAFQFNAQREEVTTYTSRIISLEADRTKSFGRGRLGTLFFKVLDERYSITSEKNDARLLMPGLRFSSQRFDSLIRPTRGHRYAVEIEGTHQALGSSLGLVRLVSEGNLIVPLPWRLSLLTRLKAGATFQNKSLDQLPASLRFFAGGDNSVRGYSYQSLGPKDAKGEVIGGKHVLVGSIELDRALFTDWGVAVFYDAGSAFNALNDITLFQGAGLGARYYTRIGALKLDFARQVGVPDPGFRIHFTVGFQL
jgi:translocation and assembly module TamA